MATALHRSNLRLGLSILAGGALVLAVGWLRPGPISSRAEKDLFWTQKVFGEEKYNLIFTGDSRIYRGISPEDVKAGLAPYKAEVLNFGFSSGGHNPGVFQRVQDRLDSTGLRMVAMGVSPFSLTPEAQLNGHLNDLLGTKQEEIFLNLHVGPRIRFLDPIEPEEAFQWFARDSLGYFEHFKKDGWVESYKIPLAPQEALPIYRKQFKDNEASQSAIDTIFMQTRKWTTEGVRVFAFRPPASAEMKTLEDSVSGFNESAFKAGFEAAGGIWLDPGPLSDYVSYDGSHVTGKSALLLSRRLGEAIRQRLDSL